MHDIINYYTSICPFESGKSGKEEGKIQKFEYLNNEKSFLDEMKNIFHSFWRAIIWWKNKKFIKNSGHKLYIFIKSHQINKKKLDKNGFVISNVDKMKNIFQRIRHCTSAQSILKLIVLKEICKYQQFYQLLKSICRDIHRNKPC